MQACPTIGAWHGYNWDEPSNAIAIQHDLDDPCLCTTVERSDCNVGARAPMRFSFARFCYALGFNPRLPVYEILDSNSAEGCPHLNGNLLLVEMYDTSGNYGEDMLLFNGRLTCQLDAIDMKVYLKGSHNPPVAFIQAPAPPSWIVQERSRLLRAQRTEYMRAHPHEVEEWLVYIWGPTYRPSYLM